MDTKLQTKSTEVKEGVKFNCPIPKAVIPFLEKMNVSFRQTGEPCMLSNMVNVEIEIKSGFDLTSMIYAGWEHGFDDHLSAVKRMNANQPSPAKSVA
jgi:hypothetical protein